MERITVALLFLGLGFFGAVVGCASGPDALDPAEARERPSAEVAGTESQSSPGASDSHDQQPAEPEYSARAGGPSGALDELHTETRRDFPVAEPQLQAPEISTRRRPDTQPGETPALGVALLEPGESLRPDLPLPALPVAIAVLQALSEASPDIGLPAPDDREIVIEPSAPAAQPDDRDGSAAAARREHPPVSPAAEIEDAGPDFTEETERPGTTRAAREIGRAAAIDDDETPSMAARAPEGRGGDGAEQVREPPLLPAERRPVGEEFTVELPGNGWVYLGTDDDQDRVEFLRRITREEHTEFVFRAREAGEFRLRFQRQDITRGEIQDHELLLTAGNDEEVSVETAGAIDPAGEASAGDGSEARDSTRELSAGDDEHSLLGDPRTLDLDAMPPPEILARAQEAYDEGSVGEAIGLYEAYLRMYNSGSERAYAHFMLGQLYERNSEHRNLKRSRGHYTAVITEHPVSGYYPDSQRRVRYLNRNFFEIR